MTGDSAFLQHPIIIRLEAGVGDYLAVDDDGAVDVGAEHGFADGIEVALQGGGGVADGDAGVNLVEIKIMASQVSEKYVTEAVIIQTTGNWPQPHRQQQVWLEGHITFHK